MMSHMDRDTYELFARIGRGDTIETRPFIQTMSDSDLQERRLYLESLRDDDVLSGTGYLELRRIEAEQQRRVAMAQRCGLCDRQGPLAPGRSICADCAHFPLD